MTPETIPAHTPIVPCPSCERHTLHTWLPSGQYRCVTCDMSCHGYARGVTTRSRSGVRRVGSPRGLPSGGP